ncbi:hypothetical protein G6F57_017787 [Rhizopus arrhizus]|nr:hypothetical protein G6F57_017787 [Rhizopus arrhizus]
MRFRVENQLGEALVAAVGNRAAGSRPREHALLDLDALLLGFVFGQADPCHFRIGVGHRRDDARVEERLLAGRGFRRHVAFMHRFVRQHRLADDVANGVDVRHVGAHLAIDRNEATLGDLHARLLGIDLPAVRRAPHGHQHAVRRATPGSIAASRGKPSTAMPAGGMPR